MNNFQEPEIMPMWRIIMWAIIAAACFDAGLYYLSISAGLPPPPLLKYLLGPAAGICLGVAIYWGVTMRANRDENGQSQAMGSSVFPVRPRSTSIFIKVLNCLLAGLMLVTAGMAIYRGHIVLGRHSQHEVYVSREPVLFWFDVLLCAGFGVYLLFITFRSPKN
jgi:hypothetical protein